MGIISSKGMWENYTHFHKTFSIKSVTFFFIEWGVIGQDQCEASPAEIWSPTQKAKHLVHIARKKLDLISVFMV